jgi:hypothetical protein
MPSKRKAKNRYKAFRAAVVKSQKQLTKGIKRSGKKAAKAAIRKARKVARQTIRLSRRQRKSARRLVRRTSRTIRASRQLAKRSVRGLRKAINARKRDKLRAIRTQNKQNRAANREAMRVRLVVVDEFALEARRDSDVTGASRPGEPPRIRTGKGRSAIFAEAKFNGKGNKVESRVYVDKAVAPYMAMWEFRKDGKQRPFLKPALQQSLAQISPAIANSLQQQLGGIKGRRKATVR